MTADNNSRSRRDFFYLAGALAVGAASGQNRAKAVPPISPQIGILLATTFTIGTLEARLDAAKANGLACVQMSMAAAGLPEMPDQIPAELPDRMRRECSARGIVIASMTGTFNMTHPDEAHRRTGLRQLRVLAEVCPRIGTSFIHICTGTRDPNSMWRYHPDNGSPEAWRDMAACVREATDIARIFAMTQVAASFVLLAGASALLATLVALQTVVTGFDMPRVLVLNVPQRNRL